MITKSKMSIGTKMDRIDDFFSEIDELIKRLENNEITLSEFEPKSRELTKGKLKDLTSAEEDRLLDRLILRTDAWNIAKNNVASREGY